jgi:hypothetical protein
MVNHTSDPEFWIAIGAMVVGGVMLLIGVVCAATFTEKAWWMWTTILLGALLAIIGAGLLIYIYNKDTTVSEGSGDVNGRWEQRVINGCQKMVWIPTCPPPKPKCGSKPIVVTKAIPQPVVKQEQFQIPAYFPLNPVDSQPQQAYQTITQTSYQTFPTSQDISLETQRYIK